MSRCDCSTLTALTPADLDAVVFAALADPDLGPGVSAIIAERLADERAA